MSRKISIYLIVLFMNLMGVSRGMVQTPLNLPAKVGIWSAAGNIEKYDAKTIYDYMDGAGEIYKQYGFVELYVQEYQAEDQPPLLAEIFKMKSSEDAFGIFSHIRSGTQFQLGKEGDITDSAISFWKGRYFVYLRSEWNTEQSRIALLELGRRIDKLIDDESKEPELVKVFPTDNLVPGSIRYFRSFILMNQHYFISTENILQIDSSTEVGMAEYQKGPDSAILIVLRYPSLPKLDSAMMTFQHEFLKSTQSMVKLEDETLCISEKYQNHLVLCFECRNEQFALDLVKRTIKQLESKENSK